LFEALADVEEGFEVAAEAGAFFKVGLSSLEGFGGALVSASSGFGFAPVAEGVGWADKFEEFGSIVAVVVAEAGEYDLEGLAGFFHDVEEKIGGFEGFGKFFLEGFEEGFLLLEGELEGFGVKLGGEHLGLWREERLEALQDLVSFFDIGGEALFEIVEFGEVFGRGHVYGLL